VKAFATLTKGITVAAIASLVGGAPASAATFVYVSNADDGEIGGERVELKERVVFAADGPRDQNELVDRPLVRAKDRPELPGIHVAGRFEDHSQGFAGDRHDAFHDPSLA